MNAIRRRRPLPCTPLAAIAVALALVPMIVAAQDHSHMQMPMPMPMPAQKPPVKEPAAQQPAAKKPTPAKPRRKPAPTHAGHGHEQAPSPEQAQPMPEMDHSTMDHGEMPGMDHATMDQGETPGRDHGAMAPPGYEPRVPVPALTDADRAAAFPDATDHAAHDNAVHSYMLLNRMEAWKADDGMGIEWEGQGWIGTDLDKLWLRSEGERVDDRLEAADVEVLYGRSVARWWDLVVGVRHDFKPGHPQDFAAIGVTGLAPQKFEVDATAYVGTGGQTSLRLEAERELLLTNRLILQPLVEADVFGKDDPQRRIGSGLGTFEAGLRLRYEVARQFAPYVGVVFERAFGQTADFRRADGHDIDDTRLVAGVRIWF